MAGGVGRRRIYVDAVRSHFAEHVAVVKWLI
jgi:hypothetical protein